MLPLAAVALALAMVLMTGSASMALPMHRQSEPSERQYDALPRFKPRYTMRDEVRHDMISHGLDWKMLHDLGPRELAVELYWNSRALRDLDQRQMKEMSGRIAKYLGAYHGASFTRYFRSIRNYLVRTDTHRKRRREKDDAKARDNISSTSTMPSEGAEGISHAISAPYLGVDHPLGAKFLEKSAVVKLVEDELSKFNINLGDYIDGKSLADEMMRPGGLFAHITNKQDEKIIAVRIGDYIAAVKDAGFRKAWSKRKTGLRRAKTDKAKRAEKRAKMGRRPRSSEKESKAKEEASYHSSACP